MNTPCGPEADAWDKILDRESLVDELLSTSLFVLTWEILKDALVSQVRRVFSFDDVTDVEAYKQSVLSRGGGPFNASLSWLKDHDVIDDADIHTVCQIRNHRNTVVHELPQRLLNNGPTVECHHLKSAMALLSKVDRWFVCEHEIPANPAFDGVVVESQQVASGRMILLETLFRIVVGDEELINELDRIRSGQNRTSDISYSGENE